MQPQISKLSQPLEVTTKEPLRELKQQISHKEPLQELKKLSQKFPLNEIQRKLYLQAQSQHIEQEMSKNIPLQKINQQLSQKESLQKINDRLCQKEPLQETNQQLPQKELLHEINQQLSQNEPLQETNQQLPQKELLQEINQQLPQKELLHEINQQLFQKPMQEIKHEVSRNEPLQEVEQELTPGEPFYEIPLPVSDLSPLHELSSVERLFITRRLRVKGVLCLRGKKNTFLVRTPDQNLMYTVDEENSWWVGYFCYGLRPMQLYVKNRAGDEVMRINRPYACTTRILPCQMQTIQVFSPPGVSIGSVEQQWTALRPEYLVKKANGEHLFWIQGPRITVSCFKDVQFHIHRIDGRRVGSTCKRWEGLMHALFFAPITDRYGIAFDRDLTEQEKALLLAASILLDYMYYDV